MFISIRARIYWVFDQAHRATQLRRQPRLNDSAGEVLLAKPQLECGVKKSLSRCDPPFVSHRSEYVASVRQTTFAIMQACRYNFR